MNLSLFVLLGAGRVVLATFAKKHHALKAMRTHNSKLASGESPVYVGPGPDHWRVKNKDQKVPKRGPDYRWAGETREEIKPDEWLEWYTSRREEAFA